MNPLPKACRHVIGIASGTELFSMSDPAVEEHIRQVQDFNIRTKRFQVPHPGHLTTFSFCHHCGAKLDREANEAAFQEKLASMGGFDGDPSQ